MKTFKYSILQYHAMLIEPGCVDTELFTEVRNGLSTRNLHNDAIEDLDRRQLTNAGNFVRALPVMKADDVKAMIERCVDADTPALRHLLGEEFHDFIVKAAADPTGETSIANGSMAIGGS